MRSLKEPHSAQPTTNVACRRAGRALFGAWAIAMSLAAAAVVWTASPAAQAPQATLAVSQACLTYQGALEELRALRERVEAAQTPEEIAALSQVFSDILARLQNPNSADFSDQAQLEEERRQTLSRIASLRSLDTSGNYSAELDSLEEQAKAAQSPADLVPIQDRLDVIELTLHSGGSRAGGGGGGSGDGSLGAGEMSVSIPTESAFAGQQWQARMGPGRVFYASPTGGGNGQRPENPGRAQTLMDFLEPGDTLVLLPGTYGSLTLTRSGTEEKPIYIVAQNPAVISLNNDGTGVTIPTSKQSIVARGVRILGNYVVLDGIATPRDQAPDGLVFVDSGYHHILVRNVFFNNSCVGLAVSLKPPTHHIGFFHNYWEATDATPPGGCDSSGGKYNRNGYGLAAFDTDFLEVRGNVFNGLFNHQISLKNRNEGVVIADNIFRGCGHTCLDLGQALDGQQPYLKDATAPSAFITNNRFILDYSERPGHNGNAVLIKKEHWCCRV
ncbi:MAG: hypothetical protein KatS3mg099_237 [Candidatus Parcubacteria bacterium]|nr:MAG: hypothetical protein KatS3mg099_237 [Candidatus Parcubacteria bacterium]